MVVVVKKAYKMENIQISKYQAGQENDISRLIRKVYDEFVAKDYTNDGNLFFYDWILPSRIAERQRLQNNILVAMVDKAIAGMIEIRDINWISLLFVDKSFQGQGIARMLFQESLSNSLNLDPRIEIFHVHASPFSIPAYMKLGFIAIDSMQETHGINTYLWK